MKITSSHIEQADKTKPRYGCRKWKLVANYKDGDRYRHKARRITGSISDAKIEMDVFLDELENGDLRKDIKFRDYSEKWLWYRIKSNSFSPNTLDNNKYAIKRINSIFGDYYLSQLKPSIIKDGLIDIPLILKTREGQASNAYKRKLHKTMKHILETAIIDGYINENPMANVPMPKNDTKERTALTKEQFDYLIDLLNKRRLNGHNVAIQLMLYLGFRRSEAIALTWDDFDKENKTLSINHSYKEKNRSIGQPKSKAGKRTIPLSDNVFNLLVKWQEEYNKYPLDDNYICCSNVGRIIQPQNLYRWWKKTILKANNDRFKDTGEGMLLPEISLHDLRHTNFTLVSRHISVFDLKDYAGWSNLEPAQIYVHQNQEALRKGLQDANL